MTRIAFVISGSPRQWTGGFNYLVNCTRVLHQHSDDIEPVLFCTPELSVAELEQHLGKTQVEVVQANWLAPAAQTARMRNALATGVDKVAYEAFNERRIDVVFEQSGYYGWRFPIPLLTWIADFQSHYLPNMFSVKARIRTRIGRRLQMLGGRTLLLSSKTAERDCHRFYPKSLGRTMVSRFAVMPAPSTGDIDLSGHYPELPPSFLYLPNQFWKHKNHALVIRALERAKGTSIVVAATGSPADHRNPGHFEALREQVNSAGLQNNFLFLGMIPRSHVVALMKSCRGLLNPSLFEGWSTTVEEAKSYGTPLCLSKIPVHEEQAPDALFFDPASEEELLSQMEVLLSLAPDPDRERRALRSAESRVTEFAASLRRAILFALTSAG